MGYESKVAELCRLSNGWEVEVYDPPASDAKAKVESKSTDCCAPVCGDYKSPWRTLAFSTLDEALAFLKSVEAKLKPRNYDDEYAKSFQDAIASTTKKPEKK